jgi:hypothetical protein
LFNRPWVVNPRDWHHYTLSSMVGFEPEGQQWWNDRRIRMLMEEPDGAFRQAQDQDQERRGRLVVLENQDLQAIVVPALGGRLWRLYHKGLQADLLRRSPLPVGGLEKGLPESAYVSLGGYEEYTARKFGSTGWGQAYQSEVAADGRSVTLTAVFANGLKLVRTVSLAADKPELTVDSRLENPSAQTVKDVVLRAHPEFLPLTAGEKPELHVRGADGAWKTVAYQSGESTLGGDNRPQGAWALRFPKTGLRLENAFEPAQVETCFFYSSSAFCNLELFSPSRDLAPGESLVLRHRYAFGITRP